jgi:hypothetical protein
LPKRAQRPRPELDADERVVDDADYVAKDGKFYPGSMISSMNRHGNIWSSVSAGVLVKRGDQTRLTCSWHCWEDHDDKYKDILGQDNAQARHVFRMTQGEDGTEVGRVMARIGETDIALAELHEGIVFENSLMGVKAAAKRLVHSDAIHIYDVFVIDAFSTVSRGSIRSVRGGR